MREQKRKCNARYTNNLTFFTNCLSSRKRRSAKSRIFWSGVNDRLGIVTIHWQAVR
jgi:hypothetical protein